MNPHVTVVWDPSKLKAAIRAAMRPAAGDFRELAARASASKRVAGSMFVQVSEEAATVGSTHPLAKLLEGGVGEHTVAPRGQVLRLKDGQFVTGPVRHPGMRARPFLRPSLPSWTTIWRRRAMLTMRASGFGGGRV